MAIANGCIANGCIANGCIANGCRGTGPWTCGGCVRQPALEGAGRRRGGGPSRTSDLHHHQMQPPTLDVRQWVKGYVQLGYTPDDFSNQELVNLRRLRAAVVCGAPAEEVISLIHLGVRVHCATCEGGPDCDEKTVLAEAVDANNAELVRVLLGYGAPPTWGCSCVAEACCRPGWSVLHSAVAWGDSGVEVATLLLAAGAQLDCAADGYTPLMLAVQKGAGCMVSLLLAAGAEGEAPLRLAKDRKLLGMTCILEAALEQRRHLAALQAEQLDMLTRRVELSLKLKLYPPPEAA
jgi:hypothetical protein